MRIYVTKMYEAIKIGMNSFVSIGIHIKYVQRFYDMANR